MIAIRRPRRLLGHGLLMLAGVCLIAISGYAAVRGLNNYAIGILDNHLKDWREAASGASAEDRAFLVNSMDQFVTPPLGSNGDVDLMASRAELLLLREQVLGQGADERIDDVPEALDAFREVLRMRPAWGRGWGRFAQVKALKDEYDEELSFALVYAVERAPKEQDVQTLIITTGFGAWEYLPQSSKGLVWTTALKALENPHAKRDILRLAARSGVADYLLPYLEPKDAGMLGSMRKGMGTAPLVRPSASRYRP